MDGTGSSSGAESATSDGVDTGEQQCEVERLPDDIVVDDAARVEMAGDVARLVAVGDQLVGCGDGFVQASGGSVLAIDGRCTGLAALDDDHGVVVTDAGGTMLFATVGDDASEVDVVEDAAMRHEDVTVLDGDVFVASGPDGLQRLAAQPDALGVAVAIPGATDARGVAGSTWGLLVADGTDGLRLIDPDGGGSIAQLDLDPGSESKRTARRVVVDGDRAYVLRGAFGFSVVDLADRSLSLASSVTTEAIALDAATASGGLLVATGSALVRYSLEADGDAISVSRQVRPAYGDLEGGWFRTVTMTEQGLVASAGASVAPVALGAGLAQPLLLAPRATHSFQAEAGESTESIVTLENRGATSVVLADLAADPFALEPLNLEGRPGCPGQYVLAADSRGLIQLTYSDPIADVVLGSFSATTDTSDDSMFSLRVEVNRPQAALGQPAPEFELPNSEGGTTRLSEFSERVVFLKLFGES